MASINDFGGALPDRLSFPPLGGPTGWAAAVAAALNGSDVTVDARVATAVTTAGTNADAKVAAHAALLHPHPLIEVRLLPDFTGNGGYVLSNDTADAFWSDQIYLDGTDITFTGVNVNVAGTLMVNGTQVGLTGTEPPVVASATVTPTRVIGENGKTYDVYDFTSSGSITFSRSGNLNFHGIAGAGGGGGGDGGGGGAGGHLRNLNFPVTTGTKVVTIGAGGGGGAWSGGGAKGQNTVFGSLTLEGGGAGGAQYGGAGQPGGSGGGAPLAGTKGLATNPLYGYDGGDGGWWASGGGGAGGPGLGTAGGVGVPNDWTGSALMFGVGGGIAESTVHGGANTGSGGWGMRGNTSTPAGTGGSGRVILRVEIVVPPADQIPPQLGHTDEFLATDGLGLEWRDVSAYAIKYQPTPPPTPTDGMVWVDSDSTVADPNMEHFFTVALSDEATDISVGTAKVTMRAPFPMLLTLIPRASLSVAASSALTTLDVNVNGASVLGANKVTIDAGEKTSKTAATPTTLVTTTIADDDELTFDIDAAGVGAKGAKITFFYRRI